MRYLSFSILFLLLMAGVCKAQSGSPVLAYFDKMPAVAANADEAYTMYFPKGKHPATEQYEGEIQEQVNLLVERSGHKSGLLSSLSKKYERDNEKYDFSKIQIARDKQLEEKIHYINTDFFSIIDSYNRSVNARLDSLRKKENSTILNAEKELQVQREELIQLIKKERVVITRMNDILISRGYNAVLDKGDASHPYYIQLLEIRGLMFDRMLKLNQMVHGANFGAATLRDYCKKNPADCKG